MTKRGTNTLKGSARFLYASANWQSDNTPESSSANGLQTNSTRFIREYGGELGGPLIEDRLWLWAAGARQDISLSPTTFDLTEVPVPETATLEPWSAKLNAQISSPNSLTLFYQRSDRSQYGTEVAFDRPPETRVNLLVPSDFYKIEDSYVFASDLFASVFGAYQKPRFSSLPVGGLDRDIEYYDFQYHETFFYKTSQQPQWQANLHVSKFFQTGPAGHELKVGFNYRTQVIDSSFRPSRQPELRGAVCPRCRQANLTRGVELSFRSEYWTAYPRRHGVRRRLHAVGGTAFRSSARPQPRGTVIGQRDVRGPVPDLREGVPRSAGGPVRRRRRLADPVRRLGAADLGHVRDRTEQRPRSCARRTPVTWISSVGLPVSSAACPVRTATSMAGTISIPTT